MVEVVVLSPLSVRRGLQRHGVGTALLAAALETVGDRGAPAVFLEGSPNYYGRRGFSSASALGFERPSTRIPDPGFQVALLSSYQPWMVGRLIPYSRTLSGQPRTGVFPLTSRSVLHATTGLRRVNAPL